MGKSSVRCSLWEGYYTVIFYKTSCIFFKSGWCIWPVTGGGREEDAGQAGRQAGGQAAACPGENLGESGRKLVSTKRVQTPDHHCSWQK